MTVPVVRGREQQNWKVVRYAKPSLFELREGEGVECFGGRRQKTQAGDRAYRASVWARARVPQARIARTRAAPSHRASHKRLDARQRAGNQINEMVADIGAITAA